LNMIRIIKKIIPKWFYQVYHYKMALFGAIFYGFPSRKIKVVGITGTKGKSTTAEIVNTILEESGFKTALSSTVHFKIGGDEKRNMYKMTMPGRFFMQKFLNSSVKKRCDWAVIEMTSEGVKQYRHKFIDLDALIVTNISPEHIESHGSFEKYLNAKLELARSLNKSNKKEKVVVVNRGDKYADDFVSVAKKATPNYFSINDLELFHLSNDGIIFNFQGEKINSPLLGQFNLENILAAATFALSIGISAEIIARAINKFKGVRGRVEFIRANEQGTRNPSQIKTRFDGASNKQQNFDVVVDYAHTIDSLTKLYEAFNPSIPHTGSGSISNKKLICVLGNTGGGRDKWKRKGMAEVADKYCDYIILTNEDPYDEDPMEILNQMKEGIKNKPFEIILDRREAISDALRLASLAQDSNKNNPIVLITGKGTDPYIMGPKSNKTPWDDATVAREEFEKFL